VEAPGFHCAGYTNLSTSDNVVHGQVNQAGNFSFVRIYESGHEVAFYQPLASLEIFERAINRKDIATGKINPGSEYLTEGTKESTYREGNSTIQFEVLPANATYNDTTGAPNPHTLGRTELVKRGVDSEGMLSHVGKRFKP
jgi:Serine carboxypeptidase